MKVKFLRSIIAAGVHQEAHTTATLPHDEAIHLIRAGDCIQLADEPETATAKHPAKETAAKK